MFENDWYVGRALEWLRRSWTPEALRTDESCGLECREEGADQTERPLSTESRMPPVHMWCSGTRLAPGGDRDSLPW